MNHKKLTGYSVGFYILFFLCQEKNRMAFYFPFKCLYPDFSSKMKRVENIEAWQPVCELARKVCRLIKQRTVNLSVA
jgi:hypothetical protein